MDCHKAKTSFNPLLAMIRESSVCRPNLLAAVCCCLKGKAKDDLGKYEIGVRFVQQKIAFESESLLRCVDESWMAPL